MSAFSQTFQVSMLRLMLDDAGFCSVAVKHLHSRFFESQALGWVFNLIKSYFETYGRPPTVLVVSESLRLMSAEHQQQLAPTVYAVCANPCSEPEFVADKVIEFVQRNLFVEGYHHLRALFNSDVMKAYDFMMERAEQIKTISVRPPDRGFFFEELGQRQARRQLAQKHEHLHTFSTGIPDLDKVLGGGLKRGELGIWAALAKVGKSTLLRWLAYFAVRALRVPVLYFVLEGGRSQTEDGLEAAFAYEQAQLIRRGLMNASVAEQLHAEYRELANLLVIRGYTKGEEVWEANVLDFTAELKDLRRIGFRPAIIIVDYGDLMTSRKPQDTTFETQKAAFRDLKKLAGDNDDDGYAIWTASQIQRAPKGYDVDETKIVKSNQIADCIEKVRVADFVGTINRTLGEADREEVRLYAELHRSNPAGRLIKLKSDYKHELDI
jgi:replicative DNA helicase